MAKTLDELLAALSPERRRKVEERAAELIEQEHRRRARRGRAKKNAPESLTVPAAPLAHLASIPEPLRAARDKFYAIAGGSIDSGDVRAAKISTADRIKFFKSDEFRNWVAYEKLCGREVFWLKDVDKTQGAGDIFTFFYKWRAENNMFSKAQRARITKFLKSLAIPNSGEPMEIVRLFEQKLHGGEGISMMDFWTFAYWPAQMGYTRAEKKRQVEAFARHYAARMYPGVKEENEILANLGVHVVIVSNGDQELAIAVAKELGIPTENVVGSNLVYSGNNRASAVVHTYEITCDTAWHERPQPGKALSFHYWLHMNRSRFGWKHIEDDRYTIAGRDGDSASSDGGMMILLKPPAIGNFMVNTPGEPDRIEKFYKVAAKYGWTKGQFVTLEHEPSKSGALPTQ